MQEWLGLAAAAATFDRQKWDQHKHKALSRLGSGDPLSNGRFRAFVAGASLTTAALLGLILWNAHNALARLERVGDSVARQAEALARIEEHSRNQDIQLSGFEITVHSIKRDIVEGLQRIARMEGEHNMLQRQ